MKESRRFGPGLLVAAAFIGPGTVTTATVAGASFGHALLWVLLFSIVATIVLQEMAARTGLVTRGGLGEALRNTFSGPLSRILAVGLVVAAIAFGNAAFQTGNLAGAAMGLEVLTGMSGSLWILGVAVVAGLLLASGTYKIIERLLVVLVCVMSLVFVITAIMVRPDLSDAARGLFIPRLPEGSLTMAIALIGTTVVPYNLFLHASSVCEKWPASMDVGQAVGEARTDTVVAVILGGIVTLAIVMTAAAFYGEGTAIENAGAMARQLEPLLGRFAQTFFAIGLLAAGLTSAITAPLAAAYATSGALGWKPDLRSMQFRAVWLAILVIGVVVAIAFGKTPVKAIIFAQAANGLILPVIAVFLLIVVNRKKLLGEYTNSVAANVVGGLVVLVAAGLGGYRFVSAILKVM